MLQITGPDTGLKVNPEGNCQLFLVGGHGAEIGTLEHQLLKCPALLETRSHAVSHWAAYLIDKPNLLPIVSHHTLSGDQLHMELLLDPSTCPKVISAVQ